MGFSTKVDSKKWRLQSKLPFFQELDNQGRPTGKPFAYDSLLRNLKQDIVDYFPELDPDDYATHSFRRFGATYAKCRGIPDDLIQHMERWVSDCFQRYFLFSDDDKVQMNQRLLS
jgi:hypothetical protein